MNDLLHRIDKLEQAIQEKENELQLLKDDLEAIRAALETSLEDQQEEASPVSEPEKAQPELNVVEEDVTPEAESPADEKEVDEEQQHEAIIRTIESFSMEAGGLDKQTLGEKAGNSKLHDLKKAFAVNERFLYANELFGGDMSAFLRAVEELNHVDSKLDAERLLSESLASKYKWDEESETVISFRTVVSRRFV